MRRISSLTVLILATVMLAGCSTKTETVIMAPATGALTVHLDHMVGGAALVLNATNYGGLDGAGNAYSVDKLRYFISNVAVHEQGGVIYALNDYHYRDASLASTRDCVLGGIPPGTYTSVSFTLGLDEQRNKPGAPISNDPNTLGMEWPLNWGGGWHYMILEGNYDPANAFGYRTHSGRRFIAAAGDPSGQGPDVVEYHHHIRVTLTFPTPIVINGNSWETTVNMELDGWYANPAIDLSTLFPNGSGGIMVNLTAQNLLKQNGPGCFSVVQPTQL